MNSQEKTVENELEKVEILTDLFHSCTLPQLREIKKFVSPEKSVDQVKELSMKN
jgi:hypothetical protein